MKYFHDLSSLDEVKKAYKKFVRQLHPDIAGEQFTAQFQEMQEEKEFAEWKLNTGYDSTGSYTSSPESKSGNAQARREEARQRSENAKRARRSEAARKAAETRRRNKEAEAYRRAQEEEAQRKREEENRENLERLRRQMEAANRAHEARKAEEQRKAQEAEMFRQRAEAEALRQREAMKKANNDNNNKNNSSSNNNSKNMKKTSFFTNVTNIAELTAQFQTLALQFITEPEKLNAIRLEYLKIKDQLNANGNDNLNGNANDSQNTQKVAEPWLQIIDYSEKSFVVTGFGEPEHLDKGHQYKYIERYFLARFEKVAGKRCSVNVNLRDGIRGIVISKKVQADVEKLVAKLNKKERPQYDPEYKSEKKSA